MITLLIIVLSQNCMHAPKKNFSHREVPAELIHARALCRRCICVLIEKCIKKTWSRAHNRGCHRMREEGSAEGCSIADV